MKDIEKEAREYRDREFQERIVRANSNFDSVDIEMAFRNGYKSCLHSTRWRKVSEELPPLDTQVLVKTSNGKFSISEMYVPKDCNGNILGDKEWKGSFSFKCSIVEWKIIDL